MGGTGGDKESSVLDLVGDKPRATPKKPAGKPSGRRSLAGPLTELFGGFSLLVATFDPVCSMAILQGGERLAQALDKLATQDPRVRRMLDATLSGGAWGEVLFASLAIAVPIAAHHGLLPETFIRGLTDGIAERMGVAADGILEEIAKQAEGASDPGTNGQGAAS